MRLASGPLTRRERGDDRSSVGSALRGFARPRREASQLNDSAVHFREVCRADRVARSRGGLVPACADGAQLVVQLLGLGSGSSALRLHPEIADGKSTRRLITDCRATGTTTFTGEVTTTLRRCRTGREHRAIPDPQPRRGPRASRPAHRPLRAGSSAGHTAAVCSRDAEIRRGPHEEIHPPGVEFRDEVFEAEINVPSDVEWYRGYDQTRRTGCCAQSSKRCSVCGADAWGSSPASSRQRRLLDVFPDAVS